MKRTILTYLALLIFAVTAGGSALSLATPQTVAAAPPAGSCAQKLLTFPNWYRGLTDKDCNIKSPGSDISGFIWKIVLNIIEIVLQLIGYLAVAFIILGGYKYMISAGSADGMVKARKTITNAIIGLVLSILSVTIVNVIAGAIK